MKLAIPMFATLLLSATTAHAKPRVANTDTKAEPPCVAWVEDKCVARSNGDADDDAKAAPAKADVPAIVTDDKKPAKNPKSSS